MAAQGSLGVSEQQYHEVYRTHTGAKNFESANALDERMHIRTTPAEAAGGIHVDPAALYATSQEGGMQGIYFADLEPREPLLVLARTGSEGDVHALAVIASFSSFGFGEGDGPLPWLFTKGKEK